MQKYLILLFSIVLPSLLLASNTKVQFISNPAIAQKKAKSEGKLVVLDFTAAWCAPCRNMEETTFNDERLAYYMRQNYVAAQVDIEDFDGIAYKKKYDIKVVPTIIILDANGRVLEKHESSLTGSQMLAKLKKYESKKLPGTGSPVITPTPPKTTKPTPTPPKTTNTIPVMVKGQGLYQFSVKRQKSEGFGVQIGVFAEYGNVLTEVEKLQSKYSQPVVVNINSLKGRTVYKVVVGVYKSRSEAIYLQKQLKNSGLAGIIKDYSTMK